VFSDEDSLGQFRSGYFMLGHVCSIKIGYFLLGLYCRIGHVTLGWIMLDLDNSG
jgi:hypothetical protein